MKESVILVNNHDKMTGTMDKMAAHRLGKLHRAFSVFVFNTSGELLLQQRAYSKYHSGGLWTNTCCSHPRLGESITEAAYRRLNEEMGITCILDHVFNFTYNARVGHGLIENEFDHVFFSISDDIPQPDPGEVADFIYIQPDKLAVQLKEHPERYTSWLAICFDRVLESCNKLLSYESLS
jgi:isopentenyl-diphosphate delta-isomerase